MTDGPAIPEALTHLAAEVRTHIGPGWRGRGVYFGDSEVGFDVTHDGPSYTVTRISRGHVERAMLRTADLRVVWLFLAFRDGFSWRWRRWRESLRVPPGEQRVPTDVELTRVGPGRHTLTWQEPDGLHRADELSESHAFQLAWALPHSLDDVIASFQDPDGLPAFPQGDARAWAPSRRLDLSDAPVASTARRRARRGHWFAWLTRRGRKA